MRRSSILIWLVPAVVLTGAVWWSYAQGTIQVGYTVVTRNVGTEMPIGTAVFSYRNGDGVLVTEAGVGATEPVGRGRVFADEVGTRTGLALVNTGPATVPATLTLRDGTGNQVGQQILMLGPGQHSASFVDELFGAQSGDFRGSVTFESASGLGAITLRESRNSRGEPLYTTLPVVDLDRTVGTDPVVFPHLAVGGGYRTQVILINRTTAVSTGRIQLVGSDGSPLQVDWDGVAASEGNYQIAADGVYRVELTGAGAVQVGYAVVTPETGSTPAGSVIFQLWSGTTLITEAGVGATPETTTARISLDNVGRQTCVAIANRGSTPAEVQFILQDRFATEQIRVTETIPAGGHLARMAQELFPSVESGFSGLVEIQSSGAVAAVTLQLTINTLGEVVLTTLPVADLTRALIAGTVIFPQVVIGSGFSTRLVFVNGGTASTVGMVFSNSDGTAMNVPIGGVTSNQFTSAFASGEGLRLFPGVTASLSSLSLRDPVTNQPTTEVTINEGNTLRARILAVDSTGKARDDFTITYASLDTTTATVDSTGQIEGRQRGFSTLTVSAGGAAAVATITVIEVSSGVSGFEVSGVAQDLSQRLYLASTADHTIRLAEGLSKTPVLYAGVAAVSGLKDDLRLASHFNAPRFLTINQSSGALYVSDSANHVVRQVTPGPSGRVAILAGTGNAGSTDGTVAAASFNNPQGVALDNRGFLWIADSANHTIRRINLLSQKVETIAGQKGTSGFSDGEGTSALFNSPTGIAVEVETTAQQLARELGGLPPPAVRIIVADTGNNVIRRVNDTGVVTTLRQPSQTSAISLASPSATRSDLTTAVPLAFRSPAGVAVDRFGSIYVTEPDSNNVRTILPDGGVVSTAQGDTFVRPQSIAVTESGKVIVADAGQAARQIHYGTPSIESVSPATVGSDGGTTVTITGRDFAPGTQIIAAGTVIENVTVVNSVTVSFVTAPLPSGRTTLTIQNRGGLAQGLFVVETAPAASLPAGFITTVAGGSTFAGDGSPATEAPMNPARVALDSSGNLFIADFLNNRVRRVDRGTGLITTIVGTGLAAFAGDGGPSTAASLDHPEAVAFDAAGNLYIADAYNGRIRKVGSDSGIVSTVAGGGEYGFLGDGGPATIAGVDSPFDVAADPEGNVFIVDTLIHRIRRVDRVTGIITTVAGTGEAGFSGDGGPATAAMLNNPDGVEVDRVGNVLIADAENHRIRRVDMVSGIITTVAGTGVDSFSGDGGLASAAGISSPSDVSVDGAGNLFIADAGNGLIRKVAAGTNVITTVAGDGSFELTGDGGPATEAGLNDARNLAIDSGGNLFIADIGNRRIRRVDANTGIITTVAGTGNNSFLGDGGAAVAAVLSEPRAVALDSSGNLFVADEGNARVRRVDAVTGIITTFAGGGEYFEGFGDGGPGTAAALSNPSAIVFDTSDNLFIADTWHHKIRRVDAVTGIISTIAGTGAQSFSGDGGAALTADLNAPEGLAVSSQGHLYVADSGNFRIRKIDLGTGTITTAAGIGSSGFSGDEGPAVEAAISWVPDIAFDTAGGLILIDTDPNSRVRRVDLATGIITTIAGGGTSIDDGVAATEAELFPIAVTSDGRLFVFDLLDQGLRQVGVDGTIRTIAGGGATGSTGDGGPAASSKFAYPRGLTFDASGNLYVADTFNNRIRVIRGPIP